MIFQKAPHGVCNVTDIHRNFLIYKPRLRTKKYNCINNSNNKHTRACRTVSGEADESSGSWVAGASSETSVLALPETETLAVWKEFLLVGDLWEWLTREGN
jgi:hypothetical protein